MVGTSLYHLAPLRRAQARAGLTCSFFELERAHDDHVSSSIEARENCAFASQIAFCSLAGPDMRAAGSQHACSDAIEMVEPGPARPGSARAPPLRPEPCLAVALSRPQTTLSYAWLMHLGLVWSAVVVVSCSVRSSFALSRTTCIETQCNTDDKQDLSMPPCACAKIHFSCTACASKTPSLTTPSFSPPAATIDAVDGPALSLAFGAIPIKAAAAKEAHFAARVACDVAARQARV